MYQTQWNKLIHCRNRSKMNYLMFLWQVEIWLAKNLLLTLHGRHLFPWQKKFIINCHGKLVCRWFQTIKVLHKINIYLCSTCAVYLVNHTTSLSIFIVADDTHFTRWNVKRVKDLIRTYILMLEHSDKTVISLEMLYIPF